MRNLLNTLFILFIGTTLTSCVCWNDGSYFCLEPQVGAGANYATAERDYAYSPEGDDVLQTKSVRTKAETSGRDNSGVIGLRIGVGARIPFNDNFSVETGAYYSGKGNKVSYSDLEDELRLSYLDIPILARYRFTESPLSLYGGFQPALLLNAKQKFTGSGSESELDVKEYFNNLGLAASFGVGYEFNNGFGLDLGYDLGMVNIYSDDYGYDAKNKVLRLSLKYTFSK